MELNQLLLFLIYSLFTAAISSVPSIDELSADWMEAVPLRGIGPVQNFIGSVGIRGSPYQGTRSSDLISMSQLTFAPFDGNMINSTLTITTSNYNISLLMNETKWSSYEVARRTSFLNYYNNTIRVTNRIRLGFEKRVVMSKYIIEQENITNTNAMALNLSFNLTGPIFEHCGVNLATHKGHPCGWGVALPTNRSNYHWTVVGNGNMGIIKQKNNTIKSFISIFVYDSNNNARSVKLKSDSDYNTFIGSINNVDINNEILLVYSFGDSNTGIENITKYSIYDNFQTEWNNAYNLWEQRWQNAFMPNNKHFSGNLPVLFINNSKISRMYYAGALAIISLERVSLNISSRVYTISQGNPSQLNAASSMGGAGQFTWDLSFTSNVLTLLDPISTKDTLRFMVSNTVFSDNVSVPFLVPQLWDAYSLYSYPQTTPYMFDYMTAFQFISTYIRLTNDTKFLNEQIVLSQPTEQLKSITIKNYLIKLATAYKLFQNGTINGTINGTDGYITNYGGNVRCFLEVVPTYIYAIPALNYGNAYMLMSANEMLNGSNNNNYKSEAINIISMANKMMYNNDGTFNCLYPNNTKRNVRTIADYVYISQHLGLFIPREGGGINNDTLKNDINKMLFEMNNFAMNELYVSESNWFRALSLKDKIYYADNLLIMRADWGIGGSYPGLDGMIVESLSIGDNNYNRSINFFIAAELITHRGAMSQGIAIYTPNSWLNETQAAIDMNYNMFRPPPNPPYQPAWPEYFEDGSFWPETLRDIANVAASFPEAMIRTLFGYNPTWNTWHNIHNNNTIINAFMNVNRSRPWSGSLIGLKTPIGFVDVLADHNGIEITNITLY